MSICPFSPTVWCQVDTTQAALQAPCSITFKLPPAFKTLRPFQSILRVCRCRDLANMWCQGHDFNNLHASVDTNWPSYCCRLKHLSLNAAHPIIKSEHLHWNHQLKTIRTRGLQDFHGYEVVNRWISGALEVKLAEEVCGFIHCFCPHHYRPLLICCECAWSEVPRLPFCLQLCLGEREMCNALVSPHLICTFPPCN